MKKVSQIATRSSGNIFADAGIPDAPEYMLKAEIAAVIMKEIRLQGLSQKAAAEIMGIKQPDVSRILRGDLARFGLERLLRLVQKLGRDVQINIPRASAKRHQQGRLAVCAQ